MFLAIVWFFYLLLTIPVHSQQLLQDRNSLRLANIKQNIREANHFEKPLEQTTTAQQDSNVTLIGRWVSGECNAVFVAGGYAYIAKGRAFDILDISNAASPRLVGEVATQYWIGGIYVTDDFAYIADGRPGIPFNPGGQ